MKTIILLALAVLGLCPNSGAQVLSNQVINAAGDHRQSATLGISLTDNIGEPFTESLGPVGTMMITQGFLQPMINIGLMVLKNDPTCSSRDDGYIKVMFSSLNRRHSERYFWSSNTPCPAGGCDSSVSNLAPGVYSVMIVSTSTNNANGVTVDTIRSGPIRILPSKEACLVKVFSGVTPNGDNVNDGLFIENIDLFPNNRVTIYSRWGAELFDSRGYDNVNNVWPRADELNGLTSSTYFYIIDLGDGSRPLKGWIELLKN